MNLVFSNFIGFNPCHYASNHQKHNLLITTSKISYCLLQLQFKKPWTFTLNQPAIVNSTHSRSRDTPTSHFQSQTWSRENFSILGVTQGSLELTLPPYSLDKHQKLIHEVLHPPFLLHPWLKPGKHPALKYFLLCTNTTHPQTTEALQTTKITKISLRSLPRLVLNRNVRI